MGCLEDTTNVCPNNSRKDELSADAKNLFFSRCRSDHDNDILWETIPCKGYRPNGQLVCAYTLQLDYADLKEGKMFLGVVRVFVLFLLFLTPLYLHSLLSWIGV
jgi:hypothetical protein